MSERPTLRMLQQETSERRVNFLHFGFLFFSQLKLVQQASVYDLFELYFCSSALLLSSNFAMSSFQNVWQTSFSTLNKCTHPNFSFLVPGLLSLPELLWLITVLLLPPQGFRPEAKSRGGTLVTRAYIKESTYSSNIQSVY